MSITRNQLSYGLGLLAIFLSIVGVFGYRYRGYHHQSDSSTDTKNHILVATKEGKKSSTKTNQQPSPSHKQTQAKNTSHTESKELIMPRVRSPSSTTHIAKPFSYELANALNLNTAKIGDITEGHYDTKALQSLRETTKDPKIYTILIERLQDEHKYDTLVAFLKQHKDTRNDTLGYAYVQALWESTSIDPTQPDSIQLLQDTIVKLRTTNAITAPQAQQENLLIDARKGNIDALVQQRESIIDTSLREDIESVLTYYNSQKDVPIYYRDALIAMTLAEHGRFSLAEKIILPIYTKHVNYLLPIQVLAYSSFIKNERDTAQTYLKNLATRDQDQSDFYLFLQGIASYRQGKYDDTILFFNQVQDPRYALDISRYLILSYDHLNDHVRRDSVFANLLQYKLEPSDYYTYFYLTLFRPFQEGKREKDTPPSIDMKTMKSYVQSCRTSLKDQAYVVCQYGAAGGLFVHGKIEEASATLLHIYRQYPLGYIARAIGDYYLSQNKKKEAMGYYYRAFRDAGSPLEKSITKKRMRQLGNNEEQ